MWRPAIEAAGIRLSSTLSPQPAVSLEAWILLFAGIAWGGWLVAQPWDGPSRRIAASVFAGGVAILAAVALGACRFGVRVPGWLDERGFGPFPNRNHTGHVLALGAVMALGCAGDAMRRKKWPVALPWAAAAGVIIMALVVNYSRGGMLMFFGAMVFWSVLTAWRRRSPKVLALGGSALLALFSFLILKGGPLAARFSGGPDSQVSFRERIWKDALALIHGNPWCGVGLGNFAALFPFFRHASVIQQGVLHPESDWLWLVSEAGWLAAIFVALLVIVSLHGALKSESGSLRRLRGAALAAGVAAGVHSLIDVPGHRIGSVFAALLVLVLAGWEARPAVVQRGASVIWRVLGSILVVAAGWLYTTRDFQRLPVVADGFLQSGRFAEAEVTATRALARAPLEWRLYFTRAEARACRGHMLEAIADFRRARLLEPTYAGVPLEEGRFWVSGATVSAPALALSAWTDALQRVVPPEDDAIFRTILDSAPADPAFRASLLEAVRNRPGLLLVWFLMAPPSEASAHYAEISSASKAWSKTQRTAFQRRAVELGVGTSPSN